MLIITLYTYIATRNRTLVVYLLTYNVKELLNLIYIYFR